MTIAKEPVMSYVFRLLIYTLSRSPSKSVRSLSDMLWLLSLRSLSTDIRQVSCLSDHRHPARELSCQTKDIRQLSCLVRPLTSGKWAVVRPQTSGKWAVCQATDIRKVSCLVRPQTSGKWAVLSDHRHSGEWAVWSDHRHPASELYVRPQTSRKITSQRFLAKLQGFLLLHKLKWSYKRKWLQRI